MLLELPETRKADDERESEEQCRHEEAEDSKVGK